MVFKSFKYIYTEIIGKQIFIVLTIFILIPYNIFLIVPADFIIHNPCIIDCSLNEIKSNPNFFIS